MRGSQANDTAGIEIKDDRERQPTFPCPDVRDISGSFLVRGIRREILAQQMRRDIEGVIAIRRDFVVSSSDNLDPVLTPQPSNSTLANSQSLFLQIFGHAGSSTLIECKHSTAVQCIALQAEPVLLSDMGQKHHIVPLGLAGRSCSPSTKATRGNMQCMAQKLYGPSLLPGVDKGKPRALWPPEEDRRLFSTSLSSRRSRFSLRKRAFSYSTSSCGPDIRSSFWCC